MHGSLDDGEEMEMGGGESQSGDQRFPHQDPSIQAEVLEFSTGTSLAKCYPIPESVVKLS